MTDIVPNLYGRIKEFWILQVATRVRRSIFND